MKKENIYIDISKCSEKEINRIFSLLPKDEITAQIYYMIRNSDWEVLKSFSHLFFNENSVWQLCSNRSTETYGKTELTYPEFIKLFEGETCPKCRTKDFENCHSIRCPMRDEKLFEGGEGKEVLQVENEEKYAYTKEDIENAYRAGENNQTYYFKDSTVILPTTYEGVDG